MSAKVHYHSSPSSYTSLTLGVMQSSAGMTVSLAAMLAYKVFPSLSPRAPEFRRPATPTFSQRRSRRSSVDTVATETSIDSVTTLVEPEIKRKRRVSAASIREPLIKFAKKEIRPLARRMSDAVSSPFTTSTTSPFSPASDSYFPRVTKAAMKKARRNSADLILLRLKMDMSAGYMDDTEPSAFMRKSCSLVPEESISLEVDSPAVEESPLKIQKRKVFRPVKMGRKISRACVKVFS